MPLRETDGAKALSERREKDFKTMLAEVGAFEEGHFVLKSGRHSSGYINKDALFTSPLLFEKIGAAMSAVMSDQRIDVVLGPAVGGAILAPWIARGLCSPSGLHTVYCAFADKNEEGFVIRRGYDRSIKGKRVCVCEDITSTGESAAKVAKEVERHGGIVVGVVAIWNRGNVTALDMNVPLFRAVVTEQVPDWHEADCPHCRASVPIRIDLGHGAAYLASKK